MAEPWLDKRGLAEHFACSVRSIETALAQGMPSRRIFGRPKFKVSIVEPWLEEHGHIEHADATSPTLVTGSTKRPGGVGAPPGLDTRS